MEVDITKLLTNKTDSITIDNEVIISNNLYQDSLITKLKDTYLKGKIFINENNEINLIGNLTGIMILKDDVTLDPFEYVFNTEIDEIINKKQNYLDISDILWQNILVEIPSKVRCTDEDIEINGDGWRVISEEKFNSLKEQSERPFSNLNELIMKKESE